MPALDTALFAEAPEGIRLMLRPAGPPARVLAFTLDLLIRLALLLALGALLEGLPGVGPGLWFILYFLLEWFYPVLFELLPGSATPGKRVLGLQVLMDDGLPVRPDASLLRNLLRAADFLPALYGLGLASMLLRSDFKRLGDVVAGTLVVHAAPAPALALPCADPASAPPRALSADEQAAVLHWAARRPHLTAQRAQELAQLARPLWPGPVATQTDADPNDDTERLSRLAQWLLGHR